jgi:hypothetical protein
MGRKAPRRRLRVIARRSDIGEHVEVLASAGYRLEVGPADQHTLRALAADPPAAVVIDLSRQPSLGRDIGVALRHTKRTRHIPLVFGGGAPDKVARVKEVLPDATYADWSNVRSALRTAMRRIDAADRRRPSRSRLEPRRLLRHSAAPQAGHQAAEHRRAGERAG